MDNAFGKDWEGYRNMAIASTSHCELNWNEDNDEERLKL
jgi:hypothetical protein